MGKGRDQDELQTVFNVQVRALRASCASYDQGHKWEALRLATATFVLVHDGGKSAKSILSQMGIKNSMKFVASGSEINPRNVAASMPLVLLKLGRGGMTYVPRLDHAPHKQKLISFDAWWEKDCIYASGRGRHKLNRKKLVFALRNLEGGSHYDAELKDPNYIQAAYGKDWVLESEDGEKPVRQLELATMRQVVWELLETFERAGYLDRE